MFSYVPQVVEYSNLKCILQCQRRLEDYESLTFLYHRLESPAWDGLSNTCATHKVMKFAQFGAKRSLPTLHADCNGQTTMHGSCILCQDLLDSLVI
jgi:hypothetical protein